MDQLATENVDRPRRQHRQAGVVQRDLHDGRLGRARFGSADPPAGRHARPDGQARRLDHRDADHRELPRRPERPAVLHLDARRAQGPGRHRAEDRQLGLPDAPPGRRHAGPGGHRGRLRHHQRRGDEGAGRGRRGHRGAARPDPRSGGRGRRDPSGDAGDAVRGRHAARRGRGRRDRAAGHRRSARAHAADLRDPLRPVRQVLRPRPRARRAGQHRRGGRRDRRAVDRRAGHAADDAHLPHRRRGIARGGGQLRSKPSRTAWCASPRRCAMSPTRRASRSSSRAPARSSSPTTTAASASVTRCRTAPRCWSATARRSRPVRSWPPGIR